MDSSVAIIDDDAAVRDSLRMVLESYGYRVDLYETALQFLSKGSLTDCLIVDVRMPGMSGPELQQELNHRKSEIPVIIITGHGDVPLAVNAMQAGAVDFLEKPFDDERILQSITRALEVGRQTQDRTTRIRKAQDLLDYLTPREREVFDKLVTGLPNKLVAHALGISPRTVEIHRAKILDKLAARNLSDLVRIAMAAA